MKRDDAVPDHVKPVIAQLIKQLGCKRAAKRAIDAAGTKGQGGRRKGTEKYLEADLKLLVDADLLRTEYALDKLEPAKKRLAPQPRGRRSLIAEVVPKNAAGSGKSRSAVAARLAKRRSAARLVAAMLREDRPDLMTPEDAELRSVESDPGKVSFGTLMGIPSSGLSVEPCRIASHQGT
jgi:hypothetical protein